jgi:hypothetical protein
VSEPKKGKPARSLVHVQDLAAPGFTYCGDEYIVPVVCPSCIDRMMADRSIHVLSPKSSDRSLCGRVVRGSQIAQASGSGYMSVRKYDDLSSDPDSSVSVCKFCVANLERMRISRGSGRSPGGEKP